MKTILLKDLKARARTVEEVAEVGDCQYARGTFTTENGKLHHFLVKYNLRTNAAGITVSIFNAEKDAIKALDLKSLGETNKIVLSQSPRHMASFHVWGKIMD